MKWKREEDCDCCWALNDPESSEVLCRVTIVGKKKVEARVFLALGEFKDRKSAQAAAEKFLKRFQK